MRCANRRYSVSVLEPIVWREVQKVITNPEIILAELEKQNQQADQAAIDHYENEIKGLIRELRSVDRDQQRLLQWAMAGFPEEQVISENKRYNARREALVMRKAELEQQIVAAKQAEINLENLEQFISLVRDRAGNLDHESKRLALDALQIGVTIDGNEIRITGNVPITAERIALHQSREAFSRFNNRVAG